MHIERETPHHPEAIALIGELDAYQDTLYPAEARYATDLGALVGERVVFVVARDDDRRAVGCGAVVLDGPVGELKRMYVRPPSRGLGVARQIIGFLEAAAAERGCGTLRLETGPRQPEALAFYARQGYRVRGPFGSYPEHPLSVFMEKTLPPHVTFFDGHAVEELAQAFLELHQHYVGTAAPTRETVLANLRDDMLAPGSGIRIVVAVAEGSIAGLATFALLYPAPGAQGQLFMKDLFVRHPWRGQGVGEAIMSFLARHALSTGCVRFDWTTERGNMGAIAFYERLGAARVEEKVYFRLTGETLAALAAGGEPGPSYHGDCDPGGTAR